MPHQRRFAAPRRWLLACALGATLTAASAQTAPVSVVDSRKDDPVLLNPFQVSTDKDSGYAADSSLAGGRANTPLRLTPASISVMTPQFMDDMNVTNLLDAIGWTVNVETRTQESLNQQPYGSFEMNFRNSGGAGNYPTRNYFSFLFNSDSYNSERYEFSRGPNSLLFGSSSIGGLSGNLTKMARFAVRRGEVRFIADSYGGWRTAVDYNEGSNKFALRFNGLVQRYNGFLNGTFTDVDAFHLAGSYKLAARTQLRAEFEHNDQRESMYNRYYQENASLWDRVSVNSDNTPLGNNQNLGARGLTQISATTSYPVYTLNNPGAGILDYRGNQYRSTGTGYRIPWIGRTDLPNFARLPAKDFRLGPADARAQKILNSTMVFLDHSFSENWFAQIAGATHVYGPTEETTDQTGATYFIDVNRYLPSPTGTGLGALNPNYLKPYTEVTMGRQYQENTSQDVRVLTSFRFERARIFGLRVDLKQRVSLIGGYRRGTFEMWTRATRWVNNPAQPNPTNAVNQIRYRIYWDQPLPNIGKTAPAGLPGLPAGARFEEVATGYAADDEGRSMYGQIVSNTTFFADRLSIIAGMRRDRSRRNNLDQYGFDASGRILMGAYDPVTKANKEGIRDRTSPQATTSNLGVVYYILPWLGLNANYSENFSGVTTGLGKITGGGFQNPRGKGTDIGLKFALADNRLYATASYYNSQSIGTLISGNQTATLNRIWTNLGYTDAEHTALAYRDVQSLKAKGYEFEATANLFRGLRVTLNHARPDTRVIESNTGLAEYFAQNLPEFENGARAAAGQVVNGRVVQSPNQIALDIQTVKDFLNGLTNGSLQNGTLKHVTNVTAAYSFTRESRLRGLTIGGGGQFRGARKVASVDAQIKYNTTAPTVQQTRDAAFDYLWVPSTTQVTAFASYDWRLSQKLRARVQLNVSNLLDDDRPQWSGYGTLAANQLLNGNPRRQVYNTFVEFDPRKFTLTTTVSF